MKSINPQRLYYFIMLGLVLSIFVFAGCHAHHHGHHHGHNHAHHESETASQSGLSESELEAMQMQASQSGVSNTEQKSAWCSEFPKSSVCQWYNGTIQIIEEGRFIHCGFLQMPTLSFRSSTRSDPCRSLQRFICRRWWLGTYVQLKTWGPILMMEGYFSSMHRNPR